MRSHSVPMNRFEEQTVLIIGATTGIGFAAARRVQQEGARIIITGRDRTRLQQAAAELGDAPALELDVASAESRGRFVDALSSHTDRVDALIYNAGIAGFAPFEAFDEAGLDHQMAVNFKGPFFTVQALLPMLHEGSAIVFNTSINNQVGMPSSTVYAASKAALRSLSRTLAGELMPRGIRVNAVSPGPVETPIYQKLGLPPEQLEAMAGQVVGNVPLGRFGKPDEIAGALAFAVSGDASFMVGEEIVVDGGWTAL